MTTGKQFDRYSLSKTFKMSTTDEGIREVKPVGRGFYSATWSIIWDTVMLDAKTIMEQYVGEEECWLKVESITRIILYVGKTKIYVYELHKIE